MGSTATASTTTITAPATNGWHLAGIIAAPSLGAVILNGIGFFNMLGALGNSSLGETGAHWILAGGLELGIIGFAIAAFCLSLLNRPNRGSQTITWVLSIVSATIGFTHIAHTGDEVAVRWLVTLAPVLAAGTWHWTLKNVKSVLVDDDLEKKAEADMMRAAIAARMDHARLDDLATSATGLAKWIADARLANAASRSYRTQKAVALGVAPHRQKAVSETFVTGAVSVASVLAEVRPIDVSVPTALTQALTDERSSAQAASTAAEATSSSAHTDAQPSGVDERSTADISAHQPASVSAHKAARSTAHSGERLKVQTSVDEEVSAHDERSPAQQAPASAIVETASLSAHGKRAMSARALEAAHDERSADNKALTDAQPASRLHAVPSAPAAVPAGPDRDAIVDKMLTADEKVTGAQVAKRLGLAEQSGRRELKAARERAAAARATAVNQ